MATSGKFVAYYRVSTKAQGNSGLGLDAQRESVTRYLNGGDWSLIGEFQDVESGTRKGNNRPELAKAIAYAKREKATLIIAKLDRLARNVAFVSNLMESGVDFVAADNPQANKLTIHILAAVAEAEADAISKRTKEALAVAKARGIQLGKPDNSTIGGRVKGAAATEAKAYKEYAYLVPRILTLRAKGTSFGAIAAALNQEGELTREGRPFKAMTVKRICDRLQEPDTQPTPSRRKRRHPLMEPISPEVLALIPQAAPHVSDLKVLASSPETDEPIRIAAEAYIKRYEELVADPDRWVPRYIENSIDQIVAMSRFNAPDAASLLDPSSSVPMARQLRRQALWAWLKNDAHHLAAGRDVYEPFMCDVAPRHLAQRKQYQRSSKDAQEFYVLAHFTPTYFEATGRLLSYLRKGLPEDQSRLNEPDFIVLDLTRNQEVGVELTDAIAGRRAARDKRFWELAGELDERLGTYEGSVVINDRQYDETSDIDWEAIAKHHREAFLNGITERVLGASRGKFRLSLGKEPGLKDILISFQKRKGVKFVVQMDQYGWSGDTPESLAADNLMQALTNKARNPAPYSTEYTILVVYPISHAPTKEYDGVLAKAGSPVKALLDTCSRFQEAWVNKEGGLWALKTTEVTI